MRIALTSMALAGFDDSTPGQNTDCELTHSWPWERYNGMEKMVKAGWLKDPQTVQLGVIRNPATVIPCSADALLIPVRGTSW